MTVKQTLPVAAAMALRELWGTDRKRAVGYARELRRRGYPLSALADALGVTRQRMHQHEALWLERGTTVPRSALRGLPLPPHITGKPGPKPPEAKLSVEDAALTIGLWQLSGKVRGRTRPDTLEALAVPALAAHLKGLRRKGHTMAQVADHTGIPYAGLRRRMVRYGKRGHGQAPTEAD